MTPVVKPDILVVGSTGNTGGALVQALVRAGHSVRVLARDPKKTAALHGSRVDVVAGDLRNPRSLRATLVGVTTASLATSPSPALSEEEGNFIEVARAMGLQRLVKLPTRFPPSSVTAA